MLAPKPFGTRSRRAAPLEVHGKYLILRRNVGFVCSPNPQGHAGAPQGPWPALRFPTSRPCRAPVHARISSGEAPTPPLPPALRCAAAVPLCTCPHAGPVNTHTSPPPPPFPRPAQGGCQRALAPTCFAPRNGHYLAPREGPCPCVPFPTQGPYTHTPSCYAPHGQGPARPLAPLASPPHTYLHEAKTQQNILVHSNAIWDGTRCVPSMLNVRNIWHGIYGHSMLLNGL